MKDKKFIIDWQIILQLGELLNYLSLIELKEISISSSLLRSKLMSKIFNNITITRLLLNPLADNESIKLNTNSIIQDFGNRSQLISIFSKCLYLKTSLPFIEYNQLFLKFNNITSLSLVKRWMIIDASLLSNLLQQLKLTNLEIIKVKFVNSSNVGLALQFPGTLQSLKIDCAINMPLIQFNNSTNLKLLSYRVPTSNSQLLNSILDNSDKLKRINVSIKSLNQETFNLLSNLKYLDCLELDLIKTRIIHNFEINELPNTSTLSFGAKVNDSSWPLIQKIVSRCKNLKKLTIPYNFKNLKCIKQIIEESGKLEDLTLNCAHMWKSIDNSNILSISVKKLTLIDFYYLERGLQMLKTWPKMNNVIIEYNIGDPMRLENFNYAMSHFPSLNIKQLNYKKFIINGF